MINIGITGQQGFIGNNLYNLLKFDNEINVIEFLKSDFDSDESLLLFVNKCDVIVHLAGINRHTSEKVLKKINIELSEKLVYAIERSKKKIHLIFASSTQESNGTAYGEVKKQIRKFLYDSSIKLKFDFSGLIIPNVFGCGCKPNYNSFISTFSHKLCNDETPTIIKDNFVSLIYVDDLNKEIINIIKNKYFKNCMFIDTIYAEKVSSILNTIEQFKFEYLINGIIPNLYNKFQIDLFNTFRSYIDNQKHFPIKLIHHNDERGIFSEVIKTNTGGQFSYSTTFPGVTRGNHFHIRKIERFAVIEGKAKISMRKIGTNNIEEFELNAPSYVDIPIWYTHNIINIGNDKLITLFWVNEFFNKNDPDTYFEKV